MSCRLSEAPQLYVGACACVDMQVCLHAGGGGRAGYACMCALVAAGIDPCQFMCQRRIDSCHDSADNAPAHMPQTTTGQPHDLRDDGPTPSRSAACTEKQQNLRDIEHLVGPLLAPWLLHGIPGGHAMLCHLQAIELEIWETRILRSYVGHEMCSSLQAGQAWPHRAGVNAMPVQGGAS